MLSEWLGGAIRRTVSWILVSRTVPKHVAFIMDGNRRYAERQSMHTIHGHSLGYQRLIKALEWCLDLGITCVSVYGFSIDNYKRSPEEVETLMKLAEDKLRSMMDDYDVLVKHGVRVCIIGDLSLAPDGVRQAAHDVMAATKSHSKAILNICFSYSSSREIEQALNAATHYYRQQNKENGNNNSNDRMIEIPRVEDFLYTAACHCPPVDLLVRTSGEHRLSDFMLKQSDHALLVFIHVLWPDFGFLDLISAVLKYQKHYESLQRIQKMTKFTKASSSSHSIGIDNMATQTQQQHIDLRHNTDMDKTVYQQQPCLKALHCNTKEEDKGTSDSPIGVATPRGSASSPTPSPSSRSDGSSDPSLSLFANDAFDGGLQEDGMSLVTSSVAGAVKEESRCNDGQRTDFTPQHTLQRRQHRCTLTP